MSTNKILYIVSPAAVLSMHYELLSYSYNATAEKAIYLYFCFDIKKSLKLFIGNWSKTSKLYFNISYIFTDHTLYCSLFDIFSSKGNLYKFDNSYLNYFIKIYTWNYFSN